MFRKNQSGQFVYFGLVSALSGNPVVGQSGGISGRISIDGGNQAATAGFVGELAGGQYVLNGFAADFNGNNLGFFFTASGCVPVSFSAVTLGGISGFVYSASGVNAVVPPASLSGVIANSGLFVSVPPATLSGLVANSGLFVSVLPATLSGVVANSGLFVNAFVGSGFFGSGSLLKSVLGSGLLAVEIPDGVLRRDFTGSSGIIASGMSGRCLVNANRKLINKWDFITNSGRLTVFQEDDTSQAFMQDFTSTSGAAPVTGLDTD